MLSLNKYLIALLRVIDHIMMNDIVPLADCGFFGYTIRSLKQNDLLQKIISKP